MQQQEKEKAYKCSDYMHYSNFSPDDRAALCNWGYQVIDECSGVSASVAVIAISYFDRFMSASPRSASYDSQLVFVSCLFIALKAHAGFTLESQFMSNTICSGTYSADEINDMELILLKNLNWRLNGPIPHDFIDRYLDTIPLIDVTRRDFIKDCSMAIAELAVTNYSDALQYPSKIAFASIYCVLHNSDSTEALQLLRMSLGGQSSMSSLVKYDYD